MRGSRSGGSSERFELVFAVVDHETLMDAETDGGLRDGFGCGD